MKIKVEDVKIDLIDKNPDNEKIFNESDLSQLSNIIKEDGFTTPIQLTLKANGRYEIISGHRRYEAAKLLNYDTIPSIILSGLKDDNKLKLLIDDNIATRKMTPLETARAINTYKELILNDRNKGEKGITRKKIAEHFAMTESSVQRYLVLLKLIPEIQELVNKPNAPYVAFKEIANLSVSEQYMVYDLISAEINKKSSDDEDYNDFILTASMISMFVNSVKAKMNRKEMSNSKESDVVCDLEDNSVSPNIDDIVITYDMFDDSKDTIVSLDDNYYSKEPSLQRNIFVSLDDYSDYTTEINNMKNSLKILSERKYSKKDVINLKDELKVLTEKITLLLNEL